MPDTYVGAGHARRSVSLADIKGESPCLFRSSPPGSCEASLRISLPHSKGREQTLRGRSEEVPQLGSFRLDPHRRLLYRQGELVPLTPKVLDTLLVLVENGGRAVDKEELMRTVWPDTFVEEGNLTQVISTLRKALGESPSDHAYIETIPKRGYRFVAVVTKSDYFSADLSAERPARTVTVATQRRISWLPVITVTAAVAVAIALGALLLPRQGPDLNAYRYTPLVTS